MKWIPLTTKKPRWKQRIFTIDMDSVHSEYSHDCLIWWGEGKSSVSFTHWIPSPELPRKYKKSIT